MTTYRTQSAEVLNEADALERQMDWMLFAQEQDSRLWSGDEGEWEPGVPLWIHPKHRNAYVHEPAWDILQGLCTEGVFYGGADFEAGPYGNVTRPMIQEFDDGDRALPPTCVDCQVSWDKWVEPNCWVCGKPVQLSRVPGIAAQGPFSLGVDLAEIYRPVRSEPHYELMVFDDFDIDFNRYRVRCEAWIAGEYVGSTAQFIDREELVSARNPDALRRDIEDRLREEMREQLIDAGHIQPEHVPEPPSRWNMLGFRADQAVGLESAFNAEMWERINAQWLESFRELNERAWRLIVGVDMSAFSILPEVSVRAPESTACSDVNFEFNTENLYVETPPTAPVIELPDHVDLSPRPLEPPIIDVTNGRLQKMAEQQQTFDQVPITERRRTR